MVSRRGESRTKMFNSRKKDHVKAAENKKKPKVTNTEVRSKTKTSLSTKSFSHEKAAAAKKKKPKDNEDTGGDSGMMMNCPINPYPQSAEGTATQEEKPIDNKDTVTPLQRPHYGLHNQGATCYLNSVLQVFFMTTEIHNRLDPESSNTDRELRNIFKNLKETTCGTENITESLEIKNVHQERDAAECLELILNKISEQASEVFQGQLTDTTKCCKGHIIIEETNPFWTLPLSLKDTHDTYSVEKGVERIFQTKSHIGRNMVYCDECNEKTDATSGCEMEKSPQILVLLLKRFDYNTMSDVKSDCRVEVPRALQIKNKKYKLYGMVNHMGSLRGGHYTATILSNEDKTWYEFNDAHVNKVGVQLFAENTSYMYVG